MPLVQRLVTVFATMVLGFVCSDAIAYLIAKMNCLENAAMPAFLTHSASKKAVAKINGSRSPTIMALL